MSENISRRRVLKGAMYGGAAMSMTLAGWGVAAAPAHAATTIDTVVFGDPASEGAHALAATLSGTGTGALAQPHRVFHQPATAGFWGGKAGFTMKCSPTQTTYVTVKMWGSDVGEGRLMLFCNGKQVGFYALGDVDPIDIQNASPRCAGRFFYHTLPLPRTSTNGLSSVTIEIRSSGRIYPYAPTDAGYFLPMSAPSRPVYRAYTHTDAFLTLTGEPQGGLPATIPVRSTPGAEVMDTVRSRVTTSVNGTLNANPAGLDQNSILLLARAYGMPSTAAYDNAKALDQIVGAIDTLYNAYLLDPKVMTGSNQQWGGFGSVGHALTLVASRIGTQLAGNVTGAATTTNRRTAYTKMLLDSRNHWRQNRRLYTNQSMICDLGIYRANRGLAALGSSAALPESTARRYVHESVGLLPWLGPENASGTPSKPLGGAYHLFTPAGLSRELGYVGVYGEVIDWALHLYDAVTAAGGPADPALRAQLITMVKARAMFRYPELDKDGNRAMRLESVIGWRDIDYPAEVLYGERSAWQSSSLYAAAVLKDPAITGHAQQMLADGQFFIGVRDGMLATPNSLVGLSLLRVPGDYDTVTALPASSARLPMTDGQPDVVFTDPGTGVIAVKKGAEIVYFSLYWRARYGINGLARVHHITPTMQRSATIAQSSGYTASGLTYTVPNWVDASFVKGRTPPGPALQQAYAGTTQPVAKAPTGVTQPAAGVESPFSGRANFYNGIWGNYWYGMNTTSGATYTWTPAGTGTATDLVSGRTYRLGTSISVGPGATVLLHQP